MTNGKIVYSAISGMLKQEDHYEISAYNRDCLKRQRKSNSTENKLQEGMYSVDTELG